MESSLLARQLTKNSAFIAYKNDAGQVVVPAATAQVHFTVKTLDILNEFNTATWTFTTTRRGLYLFNAQTLINFGSTGFNYADLRIVLSAPVRQTDAWRYYGGSAGTFRIETAICAWMEPGSTAIVQFNCSGADAKTIQASVDTYFSGRRLV